ncbi:MAG: hypothetical protein IK108_09145 [Clostridia bacterium]|nr:hypothetical protein [Clostridia bacterium]
MKNKTQTIEVAYEASCAALGEETCGWLVETGFADEADIPVVPSGGGFVCRRFTAVGQIAMDSAIVFISDAAVANEAWQSYVRALPQEMRLIPAGGIETVDYNDEKLLPKRIEEINFIRTDGYLRENLLDSLTTDPAFYSLKNRLLLRYHCWRSSDSKAELLSNLREIRSNTEIIKNRLANENDEYLRTQLQSILEYLSASFDYTKKARGRQTVLRLRIAAVIAAAAALTAIFFIASSAIRRASLANLVVSGDIRLDEPQVYAVQMAEAMFNPYSTEASIEVAYENLLKTMDMAWPQTGIGLLYKYGINDLALPGGTRFVWTGDTGGRAALWDTYTGEITEKQKLSNAGLVMIAADEDGETLAAADENGAVYLRRNGKWEDTGLVSVIADTSSEMKLQGETVLVYNRAAVELFYGGVCKKPALGVKDPTVLCAGFGADGALTVAGSENGTFFTARFASPDAAAEIRRYPEIAAGASSPTDIKNGVIAVSDAHGQVWKIVNGDARRTSLYLPIANELLFVDESTVIYQERNVGVGLFDLDESFDYGDVLSSMIGAKRIWASGEFVAVSAGSVIYPVPIDEVLRVKNAAQEEKKAVYDRQKCEPDAPCLIKSAEIVENGVVILHIVLPDSGEEAEAQIDPMLLMANEAGYTANRVLEDKTQDAFVFSEEPFFAMGAPCVVGLRYTPPNEYNDTAGCIILIGCADGSFAELWMNAENASVTAIRIHRIPSGCAVRAVYETDGGYLLLDEGGRYWRCSSGEGMVSEKGCLSSIKAKLHAGVTVQLKESVSKDLWRKLDLKVCPGGNGKEWE